MAQGAPSSEVRLMMSSSTSTHTYDVFLSFCAKDTLYGFAGYLHKALTDRGVRTFIFPIFEMEEEEVLVQYIFKAIQQSRIFIVMFSKNFAASPFCLNELVDILECRKNEKVRILPVFYDVDPSEIRLQLDNYLKEIAKHGQGSFKYDKHLVRKWRMALTQAAKLPGSCFRLGQRYEYLFIEEIVEQVSLILNRHLLPIVEPSEKKSVTSTSQKSIDYDDDIVTSHSSVESVGKEIVKQNSIWPENRNRLQSYLSDDLETNKGKDKIEARMLDMPRDKEVPWNEEVLQKMQNTTELVIKKGCNLRSPKYLPDSLIVLEWWGYPTTSLPSNFNSKNLVILNLSHSCFQWDTPLQNSEVLSQLIFTGCKNIRQIPNLSGFPNLTELCVDDCKNLIAVHDSVGILDKLLRFSAKGCIRLSIMPSAIKLTSLESLCLRDCISLDTFPKILEPMKKLKYLDLEGTAIKNVPLLKQNPEGLQMVYGNGFKMLQNSALYSVIQMLPNFHFLGILELVDSNLTILPASIDECYFLLILDLSSSKQLREIRGLPQSIIFLDVNNCTSLETSCSTLKTWLQSRANGSSTHLNAYILPGQSIPEWFDLSWVGNSVCFWFRKEFPSLVMCVVIGVWDDIGLPFSMNFDVHFKINDSKGIIPYRFTPIVNTDHLFIFNCNLDQTSRGSISVESKWNYGEFSFVSVKPPYSDSCRPGSVKRSGVFVNRIFTRMEDIRFTNPYPPKSKSDDSSYSNHDALLYEEQPYYKYSNSDSLEPVWTIDGDQQEKVAGESSKAAKMQNIPVQSLTSSSELVRQELNLRTSSIMLQTTVDASLRKQTELTQDDDVEMEAFYASLDTDETHVDSCSYDKLATTTPSEEAKKALKIVQDFIFNDTSVLLHPERCWVMKTSLEYLSNLSEDDDISTEMRTLISETSRMFIHWSKDYIAASMKIESTTSEMLKSEKLETSLLDNKKKFREVVDLEKRLLDKLANMEESKMELEEKINVIKGNIFASQSEKNITRKRKRDIFEKGKMLKIQIDELRGKIHCLHHEHDLAKKTQTRIKSEWSEIREKFKKIAAAE